MREKILYPQIVLNITVKNPNAFPKRFYLYVKCIFNSLILILKENEKITLINCINIQTLICSNATDYFYFIGSFNLLKGTWMFIPLLCQSPPPSLPTERENGGNFANNVYI